MKTPIVLLHGWGLSGEKYADLKKLLEAHGYSVYAPDFPGFNNTPLIKNPMTLKDYADFLRGYFKNHSIKKAILIGHSFGGRVAALFAILYPTLVEKLVISGSPLVKEKFTMKKNIVQYGLKKSKNITQLFPAPIQKLLKKGIYSFINEYDYYNAGVLKQTLQEVLKEDSQEYLKDIPQPTLLLWGERDSFVGIETAKKINNHIADSKLEVIQDVGHNLPYKEPKLFTQALLTFLET